jgi:hypothetical protein
VAKLHSPCMLCKTTRPCLGLIQVYHVRHGASQHQSTLVKPRNITRICKNIQERFAALQLDCSPSRVSVSYPVSSPSPRPAAHLQDPFPSIRLGQGLALHPTRVFASQAKPNPTHICKPVRTRSNTHPHPRPAKTTSHASKSHVRSVPTPRPTSTLLQAP